MAVDGLLNELRGLLACVQEFLAFLQRTAAAAVHPKPLPRELIDIFGDGEHMRAVMELQSAYLSLEAAYVKRSVAKAIEWDSLLPVRLCKLEAHIFLLCAFPLSGQRRLLLWL